MTDEEKRIGRPPKYANQAERQAAYRQRKASFKQLTVMLPDDVAEGLKAYMLRHASDGAALTQSEVVVKLLRNQLLRKR